MLFFWILSFLLAADLINHLDNEAGEEVGGVCKEDREYEEEHNVEDGSKYADSVNYCKAHVLDEADVASVEVMEVDLQGVGEDRRDYYVDGEEDGHNLHIVLCVDLVESQCDGEHEVEEHEVVEHYGVEVAEGSEEIENAGGRIYVLGHYEHIEEERREAGKCRGVGDVAVLAMVEGVKREKIEEERAIVERKRVQVVGSALCGVDLLHHLEDEQYNRDDLQRNVLDLRLALSEGFSREDRYSEEYQDRDRQLVKVCHCPKSHVSSPFPRSRRAGVLNFDVDNRPSGRPQRFYHLF